MKKENKGYDDHHCSVIESKRLETELAECDTNFSNKDERTECHAKYKALSKKREQACKYS